MPPAVRKFALTAHVTSSVGWLGSVIAFLGLAVAGVTSSDDGEVRAVYIAMETLGEGVIVPLAFAALLTGIIQALGSSWGLFRHYWVLIKLVLTLGATVILLAYTSTLTSLADAATTPAAPGHAGMLPSYSPVVHSIGAIIVLLVALVLSIYKPRGLTPYGWNKQQRRT